MTTGIQSTEAGQSPRRVFSWEKGEQVQVATKAERQEKKLRRMGVNSGVRLLQEVTERYAGNPQRQLAVFLEKHEMHAATGRARVMSGITRERISTGLMQSLRELKEEGMPIKNLRELGRAHVVALTKRWLMQGLGTGTIQNKVSYLRRFLTWVGKDKAVPRGDAFVAMLQQNGVVVSEITRQRVSQESKSWEERGVDPSEVIQRVANKCYVTSVQMEMQFAWGLRLSESLQIEPEISDMGDRLHVFRGTKGGKSRLVGYSDDEQVAQWQRDVLERAKEIARKHPQRRLSLKGKTLAQARDYYKYTVRSVGVSKADLGVTSHGLRHGYAARRFKEKTGLVPPVVGQVPPAVYSEHGDQVRQAQLDISQELGHWRPDITGAYLGSKFMLSKQANERVDLMVKYFEGHEDMKATLRNAGVEGLWVLGKAAQGLLPEQHEVFTFAVRIRAVQGVEAYKTALKLGTDLGVVLGMPLICAPWEGSGPPDDSLEIYL